MVAPASRTEPTLNNGISEDQPSRSDHAASLCRLCGPRQGSKTALKTIRARPGSGPGPSWRTGPPLCYLWLAMAGQLDLCLTLNFATSERSETRTFPFCFYSAKVGKYTCMPPGRISGMTVTTLASRLCCRLCAACRQHVARNSDRCAFEEVVELLLCTSVACQRPPVAKRRCETLQNGREEVSHTCKEVLRERPWPPWGRPMFEGPRLRENKSAAPRALSSNWFGWEGPPCTRTHCFDTCHRFSGSQCVTNSAHRDDSTLAAHKPPPCRSCAAYIIWPDSAEFGPDLAKAWPNVAQCGQSLPRPNLARSRRSSTEVFKVWQKLARFSPEFAQIGPTQAKCNLAKIGSNLIRDHVRRSRPNSVGLGRPLCENGLENASGVATNTRLSGM